MTKKIYAKLSKYKDVFCTLDSGYVPAKKRFLHKEALLRIYLLAAEVQLGEGDVSSGRPKRPNLCPPQPAAAVTV